MSVLYIQGYVYACVSTVMPGAKSQFSRHVADNKTLTLVFNTDN